MPDSGQLESGFHRESERSMRVLRSGACCLLEYGSLKVLFIGSLERAQQEQAGATRGNRFAGGRLANGALVPFVRATSGDGGIEISGVRSRCGRHGLIRHEKHAGAARAHLRPAGPRTATGTLAHGTECKRDGSAPHLAALDFSQPRNHRDGGVRSGVIPTIGQGELTLAVNA